MKYLLFVVFVLNLNFLTGCSSTLDNLTGVSQIKSTVVSFDGSTTIELSKTRVFNDEGIMMDTLLSGRWNSSNPDYIAIGLRNQSTVSESDTYVTYKSLAVNINGKITTFNAGDTIHNRSDYNSVSRTIYTSSESSAVIPFDFFESMINENNVRVKVSTREYYEDAIFSQLGKYGEESAQKKFKKFLLEINKETN